MTTRKAKDKKNFHKHLRNKIFDMTTYLNHNKQSFKLEFLDDVVIIDYVAWLFSEHHVVLKYRTVQGERECVVNNHTFDEWLVNLQSGNTQTKGEI